MRRVLCTVWLFLLLGCTDDSLTLLLDLRTDLVAGIEFQTIRTERFHRIPTSEQVADGPALHFAEAGQHASFSKGVRVAQMRGLSKGTHVVRTRLLREDGQPILQRIMLVSLEKTAVFTTIMTRDCRDVACPGASDDPSATECLNGRCVRPACTPETPEFCPSLSCEVGITCVALAACAQAVCTDDRVCLRTEGAGCSPTEYCDPDLGCQPRPQTTDGSAGDASAPDASPTVDAGSDAGLATIPATLEGYLKASNTAPTQKLGSSVSLSSDGATLAVGASEESSATTGVNGNQTDNSAVGAGAVYVFTRTGSTWAQQAYIKASNTEAGDGFGGSVALSADGSTLAIGAQGEDSATVNINGDQADNSAGGAGAVYVFTRTGSTWAQQAYIKASNAESNDNFGIAISVSGDGATLAVGARGEDSATTSINGDQADNSVESSGAAYVFARSGDVWNQQAYIKAPSAELFDFFGGSVSLSGTGSTLAVGVSTEDSGATGVNGDWTDNSVPNSGAAHVFVRTGTTWTHESYLKASTPGSTDTFGTQTVLSDDGSTLVVTATGERSGSAGVNGDQTDNSAGGSGAVYVFARSGASWRQQAYIKSSNPDINDRFGWSAAVSASGSTLAIGALWESSFATGFNGDQTDNSATNSGAVYVFERVDSTWAQKLYIKAPNTDAFDFFGRGIDLSGSGATLACGAPGEASAARGPDGDQTDNSTSESGAAYVYGP